MDYKQRQPLPQLNHYYGTLGQASTSPAGPMGLVQPGQSLTPPSSLSGSSTNLALTGDWGKDCVCVCVCAHVSNITDHFYVQIMI